MENQSSLFFIFFSVLSVVAVGATHFYIKEKLGNKHDDGLLWVSVWLLMGLLEFRYTSLAMLNCIRQDRCMAGVLRGTLHAMSLQKEGCPAKNVAISLSLP